MFCNFVLSPGLILLSAKCRASFNHNGLSSSSKGRAAAFVILLVFLATTVARGQVDPTQFTVDMKALTPRPSRTPGSQGYVDAALYLRNQLTGLPNVQFKEHHYPMMVPFTQSATLEMPGRGTEPVYPLWPAGVRLNATPAAGITGRLVYCRDAELKDVVPADLAGQIAVIETTAGANWTIPFNMGARAVVLLGTSVTNNIDLRNHDLPVPVNLPRFFVPPGPLADALRAGKVAGPVTLKADVSWKPFSAANFYALVKPAQTPVGGAAALAITVPFDATSLVPDLAPGASQAVQTAAGLALLRDLSRNPPDRPVLVCFTGGDGVAFLGSRNLHMALSDVPATWKSEVDELKATRADAVQQLDRAKKILANLRDLTPGADRTLVQRLTKILDVKAMNVQEALFRLRADRRDPRQLEALQESLSPVGVCVQTKAGRTGRAGRGRRRPGDRGKCDQNPRRVARCHAR